MEKKKRGDEGDPKKESKKNAGVFLCSPEAARPGRPCPRVGPTPRRRLALHLIFQVKKEEPESRERPFCALPLS